MCTVTQEVSMYNTKYIYIRYNNKIPNVYQTIHTKYIYSLQYYILLYIV